MKKELKFQLGVAFNSAGFLKVCVFGVAFGVACFAFACFSEYGRDIMSVQAAYMRFFANKGTFYVWQPMIFAIIMPLLACAAFSDSYLADSACRRFSLCAVREGAAKYYFSKLAAVFICGAFAVLLPQLVNLILCLIAFPLESTNLYTEDLLQSDFYSADILGKTLFGGVYIISPYLFLVLFMLISGVFAGLISVIAYQLSYFVKNKTFVLTFMFIFVNLFGILCDFRGIGLNILSCIFGLEIPSPTYGEFAAVAAIYICAAAAPIPFALKKVKNEL